MLRKDQALIYGANNGHLDMVELLLAKGADINAKDNRLSRYIDKKINEILNSIQASKKLSPKKANSTQCEATTKLGAQCKKQAVAGNKYCSIHFKRK